MPLRPYGLFPCVLRNPGVHEKSALLFDIIPLDTTFAPAFCLAFAFFSGVKAPLYKIDRAYGTWIDDL